MKKHNVIIFCWAYNISSLASLCVCLFVSVKYEEFYVFISRICLSIYKYFHLQKKKKREKKKNYIYIYI